MFSRTWSANGSPGEEAVQRGEGCAQAVQAALRFMTILRDGGRDHVRERGLEDVASTAQSDREAAESAADLG